VNFFYAFIILTSLLLPLASLSLSPSETVSKETTLIIRRTQEYKKRNFQELEDISKNVDNFKMNLYSA
jgi:hypothetical protein